MFKIWRIDCKCVIFQRSTEVSYEASSIWYARNVASFLHVSSGQTATEIYTNIESRRCYEVCIILSCCIVIKGMLFAFEY